MHKRFFVLRIASGSGPSRLEYYENEKKWRHKSGAPKRSIPLESCFNINKRADSKNKYLVALYTKEEYFAVAADNEPEQDLWYQALVDLQNRGKLHEPDGGSSETGEDNYGEATPGPAFKEVWQVILKPKGLGQAKNLIGIYRLCLTHKTISLVKLNSDAAAVVLQLMNIRRCGHSENFFFVEVGRSAVTGPGEFWMQADDSVVAQNMHETILEAMRAMSEEFHPRGGKSQPGGSKCSTPISVPLRRHHHHNNHPPPSQVGLGRRSRAESVAAAPPGRQSRSFRVRACSDGEGSMSRPASVDGSPCSPGSARLGSQRCQGGGGPRLHPPLSHSRSIPMPSARRSPSSTTSPVSLASASGSPSDGGFVSSDEYGSSPCDYRGSFRSATPDSLCHTPPPPPPAAREEELSNYMSMTKPGLTTAAPATVTPPHRHAGRPAHARRTPPPRLEDPEKTFRKRTHSSGTSPQTAGHQKSPSQSSATSLEEYAAMTPAFGHAHFPPVHSYPEESLDLRLGGGEGTADDGYMPMSPGVAPAACKSDDYMPMSPKTVSAPQQILGPRSQCRVDSSGYMMMSASASCSPENGGYSGIDPALPEISKAKGSRADYINMSPASCSATSTPPDCYFDPAEDPAHPAGSYYSLPRSFRHAPRKQEQSPLRVALSAGQTAYAAAASSPSSSSSSASSDSLGPQDGGPARCPRPGQPLPLPLPLPGPASPGEYVSMEFSDRPFSASLALLLRHSSPSEYMNMELEAGGAKGGPRYGGKDFVPPESPVALVPGTGPALSAFSRVHPGPSQTHGTRVVRADLQTRQCHISEAFGPERGGATQPRPDDARRRGSASFDDMWPAPGEQGTGCGRKEQTPVDGAASSSPSCGHGLNYMDLDLGKVLGQPEWSFLQPKAPQLPGVSPTEEANGYASVSFPKPDHMSSDPADREE
ncbi:hypothetical protein AAFF_G00303750 [Aldrovandia affinis]|uniref:Insulin receptor substrate 1 n=1 Tax=Aldrovandia affinis TaxID=143900 RepID=A0AAD7SP46_9TELE|nr:hypothetical protein AAFF_G00303750 [Aldrovandia affinis]